MPRGKPSAAKAPPAWYKSLEYRARTIRDPRRVLEEFGLKLDPDVEVRVVDSTADLRYMVLPVRPSETEGWDEERLASLVTWDSMIGTCLARAPQLARGLVPTAPCHPVLRRESRRPLRVVRQA